MSQRTYVTVHDITITGLEECPTYFFEVASTNVHGQETVNNNVDSCYVFSTKIISPILLYDFESAGSQGWTDNLVVNSAGNGDCSPSTTPVEYEIYFYPPQELISGPIQNMFAAWDILNFDPADSSQAILGVDQVILERLEVPRLP